MTLYDTGEGGSGAGWDFIFPSLQRFFFMKDFGWNSMI